MSQPEWRRTAGITFNGKFLTAKPTGVHRVALELLRAIDGHLATEDPGGGAVVAHGRGPGPGSLPMRLLLPRGIAVTPALGHFEIIRAGHVGGQLWEQIELPRLTPDDLVVSLCNIGPLAKRRAVTLIHDAQVYLTPASYTAAFLLKYRLMLPLIGRRHRRIVTVSRYSREQLAAHRVAPPERISVVHNGVDHMIGVAADRGILQALGLAPGGFVLALANTQQHKNIGMLLRAFAAEPIPPTTLLLVGSAGRSDFAAAGHPIPDNVRFAGPTSDAALRALMESALCLAFPSKTEGFGLPPLEAMLVGCPAIVAPCGALPEVCGDAVEYCAAEDAGAWIRTIRHMRDHPEHRAERVAIGIAHARKFTWHRAAQQLLTILRDEALATTDRRRQ